VKERKEHDMISKLSKEDTRKIIGYAREREEGRTGGTEEPIHGGKWFKTLAGPRKRGTHVGTLRGFGRATSEKRGMT